MVQEKIEMKEKCQKFFYQYLFRLTIKDLMQFQTVVSQLFPLNLLGEQNKIVPLWWDTVRTSKSFGL